ncbi:hypothetical protein ACLBWS_16545 [Brucellaceae bacterium D45D]
MAQNEGMNSVYGMMAATTLLSAGAFSAHERGMHAIRAAREAEGVARYNAAVEEIIQDHKKLGELAVMLGKELAAERAKNASLQRALEQRQTLLERMRTRPA